MLPNICIKDAEAAFLVNLNYFNNHRLKDKGLELKLRKKYSISWIELRIVDQMKQKQIGMNYHQVNEEDTQSIEMATGNETDVGQAMEVI